MRWLLSSVRRGAASAATAGTGADAGRAVLDPSLTLVRSMHSVETEHRFRAGTGERTLALVGPGDMLGFAPELLIRCEPAPGAADADASGLACVEFAAADLPWAVSVPAADGSVAPWLGLLVCTPAEVSVAAGDPLPRAQVAATALYDLATAATWAHVEVRADRRPEPADVAALVGAGSRDAVARVLCPRRLAPFTDYVALVVPTTAAGRDAGLGSDPPVSAALQSAWTPGRPVELPVYHLWTFRTGEGGTFEDLACRLTARPAASVAGLGTRRAVVARTADGAEVTAPLTGALALPSQVGAADEWSDAGERQAFTEELRRRITTPDTTAGVPDPDAVVGPPLYAGALAEAAAPDDRAWLSELNLEVRHRVAASVGAAYVRTEQEFLMARAWEQAGDLNAANVALALAQLAAEVGSRVQRKHLLGLPAATLTAITGTAADQVPAPATDAVAEPGTMSVRSAIARSAVPPGAGSPAFLRLTRPGGALTRRAASVARRGQGPAQPEPEPTQPGPAQPGAAASTADDVVTRGLAGVQVLAAATRPWAESRTAAAMSGSRLADATGRAAAPRMSVLLTSQAGLQTRVNTTLATNIRTTAQTFSQRLSSPAVAVLSRSRLRGTRAVLVAESPATELLLPKPPAGNVGGNAVTAALGLGLDPHRWQRERAETMFDLADGVSATGASGPRPIAWHPRFDQPIGVEVLRRWPEWVVPGMGELPDDTVTLLTPDRRFVAAFLAGANHEFARELLWRELPADRRGSCFVRFWPSDPPAGSGEIAAWPASASLADCAPGSAAGCALVVRGELLRRFPGTIVAAVPGRWGLPESMWEWPTAVPLADGATAFLFAFTDPGDRLFVLRQPAASALFGFDDGAPGLPLLTWADLTWQLLEVPANGFLDPRRVAATPVSPGPDQPARFPADAARFARIALQAPFQWLVPARALTSGAA